MSILKNYLDKEIMFELSGCGKRDALLIEVGQEVIVLYDNNKYMYVPLTHIQSVQETIKKSNFASSRASAEKTGKLTLDYVLQKAIGLYVEVRLDKSLLLQGTITQLCTDYFQFQSLIHGKLSIPYAHWKWISPLDGEHLSLLPPSTVSGMKTATPPIQTFEELLHAARGKYVTFDLGISPDKCGILSKVQSPVVELITTDSTKLVYPIEHIRSLLVIAPK